MPSQTLVGYMHVQSFNILFSGIKEQPAVTDAVQCNNDTNCQDADIVPNRCDLSTVYAQFVLFDFIFSTRKWPLLIQNKVSVPTAERTQNRCTLVVIHRIVQSSDWQVLQMSELLVSLD